MRRVSEIIIIITIILIIYNITRETADDKMIIWRNLRAYENIIGWNFRSKSAYVRVCVCVVSVCEC